MPFILLYVRTPVVHSYLRTCRQCGETDPVVLRAVHTALPRSPLDVQVPVLDVSEGLGTHRTRVTWVGVNQHVLAHI